MKRIRAGEVPWKASRLFRPALLSKMRETGYPDYVRRQVIFGKTKCNARWLENRKDRLSLHQIDAEISRHAKGTNQRDIFMGKLRSYQANGRRDKFRGFYTSASFERNSWSTQRSIRLQVDCTCNLLLGSAKRVGHANQGNVPIVMGLDGQGGSTSRKDARSPMDNKDLDALARHAKQHGYPMVRINDCTNQICRHCLQDGKQVYTKFLQVKVLRVKMCSECKYYFHKDGMATHSIILAADALLRISQRLRSFIPPYLRVSTDEQGASSGTAKEGKQEAAPLHLIQ